MRCFGKPNNLRDHRLFRYPSKSTEDCEAACYDCLRRLTEAATLLGLRVLDHIIVTRHSHYSFQKAGRLEAPSKF